MSLRSVSSKASFNGYALCAVLLLSLVQNVSSQNITCEECVPPAMVCRSEIPVRNSESWCLCLLPYLTCTSQSDRECTVSCKAMWVGTEFECNPDWCESAPLTSPVTIQSQYGLDGKVNEGYFSEKFLPLMHPAINTSWVQVVITENTGSDRLIDHASASHLANVDIVVPEGQVFPEGATASVVQHLASLVNDETLKENGVVAFAYVSGETTPSESDGGWSAGDTAGLVVASVVFLFVIFAMYYFMRRCAWKMILRPDTETGCEDRKPFQIK